MTFNFCIVIVFLVIAYIVIQNHKYIQANKKQNIHLDLYVDYKLNTYEKFVTKVSYSTSFMPSSTHQIRFYTNNTILLLIFPLQMAE